MTKVNVYLNFAGNTEEAFNFYKSVFGGEFRTITRFKDMPMPGVKTAKEDEKVKKWITKNVKKTIFVPGKLINFVI